MSKKSIITTTLVTLATVGFFVFLYFLSKPKPNPKLDDFAKCLTDKKVVMYGAYWCPHCKDQKKLFGDSFQYINYVECTKDIALCQEKNIKGYPTWIFSDESRVEGEMSFSELAGKSFCEAP